ncbi:hypothetical protein [Salinisphaera sp. G21_0]|uniref:hypothetical protein n=1 Tax=Salinisphaera sp. G21_0 TaxID=2821094 RepID=UPI001ADC89E4|nr:hypothetical protein [Salinisphaera sp. G21_0]MBO9484341.1 hypothetical protein [Salinisphaera sp. G21_0]
MENNPVYVSFSGAELKESQRQSIAADVAAFLAKGKAIKQISSGTVQKEIPNLSSIAGEKQRSRTRVKKIDLDYLARLREEDSEKLLGRAEVMQLTGLSKSAINHWGNGTCLVEVCRPLTFKAPHLWRNGDLIQWCDHAIATAKG